MSIEAVLDAVAPEFVADAAKATFISLATARTSTVSFGDVTGEVYELAAALRAAHMMSLRDKGTNTQGNSGKVATQKEGDLSVGFGPVIGVVQSVRLDATSYGMQLMELINGQVMTANVRDGVYP